MDEVDCVVVGAGVVGLAVARALALAGRAVLVLEAADTIGSGTSSRNSEVIHAGIYYAANSLKARLCVTGNKLLYAYCEEKGIAYKRCGKLIVACGTEQVGQLTGIADKAQRNGVTDLVRLERDEARSIEPELVCDAALLSPSTGIVDSHALMLALQADLENADGMVVLRCALAQATITKSAIELLTNDGTTLRCKVLVNAAGLQAPLLAHQFLGLQTEHVPQAFFAKGNYFALAGRAPFSHLVYPVPEAAGLGVHLTLDLAGQARFGPDVQWVDSSNDLCVDSARGDAFYSEVRKYWPGLKDGALLPAYAGIRPKISGPNEPARDFLIQGPQHHGHAGLVNLFGIESPGLTSALAIGQEVLTLLNVQ
ncbi:MAG: NAD(P)/FAD-dependent oxidoreductase [Rhodoferax sp.]|uniref:NAD(P)/FAD-dependent oxidoreductase n=1 Tax=Rhodoferax sp. TaxID=50421 RepID=UPI002621C394|nr:NAD(P)/FAD-dependent oxidoreductase [Rhodoferax sp.]MDD2882462.1 NAD(P)/FAD-dependent oxidoreductase [Rhodoferax sp.]